MNLSLDELRLIAKSRNIGDYEKKRIFEEDLIKVLSQAKPEPEPNPKPESEPKIEIRINNRKLKKLRKDFNKLRNKFSKEEIKEYRKAFYNAKKYKHLSESEIKKTNKNFKELKKSLWFKKCCGNIDSVDYEDLDNYDYNYDFADDDEYRKIESIRTLFKELDSDYCKPTVIDRGFAGEVNNYIEYKSKGDRYENLSPKEYLNVVKPYLRDFIDEHKSEAELNNNNNKNNNNDNINNNSNNNSNSNNNNNNNNNNSNNNSDNNSNNRAE